MALNAPLIPKDVYLLYIYLIVKEEMVDLKAFSELDW